ncbi:protein KIAA0100 isoform X2 [Myzus persicae]|uniref:protein KIAA0100 isoform X2 n=1 Tax=Myzus persicae TaxID=13164 RepID=UPI000B939F1D|nr:protein KIAA0100 isoform X2 [Myzus persicae]
MIEFNTVFFCVFSILLYSLKWLLPKAISLYLKYKYHLNVKIGTAGIFSLQDIIFLKNGYSVHIDNIGFRSSFISSEVNKLVCLVARDVRIEKNIERNDSIIIKQNQSNNKIEDILPIVMKFAQFLAVRISRISIVSLQPNTPEWLFIVSVIDLHLDASVIGSSRQLLANVNAPYAEAKLLRHPMNPNSCCLAKITVNVCAESILDTHEPLSIQSLMLKLDKSKIVLNKGLYSFIQNNRASSTLSKNDNVQSSLDMAAKDISIPPLVPKKIKIHLEELTIVDVKDNLVTEMKGELKLLTIENLIIPDDNNDSIKQSNLSLKVNFESLCLIGHEETYVSLEKFSFEAKYFKKSFKFDLKINNVYTLYSHDDIYQWYTSYTDQMLNPHQLKSTSPSPANKLLISQNSPMDDISIDLLVQFLNVTTICRLGSECASVSLNKFKLMLSCNPVLRNENHSKVFANWPIGLCHRKWTSDLMLETVRCWLKPFTNTEYSPGMKKCHSWGTPLFIGLVLIKNSIPSNAPRLNVLLDTVRLEWSPPLAQFILRAHNSLQQIVSALEINLKSKSNDSSIEDQKLSISKTIPASISVTNANIFLIADKKICVLVRVDTISADIGTSRIICAIEGLKCDSLVPTKYHYVCTSSDDIKSWWLHIKSLKLEKILETKEILIEINEIFECRWSANVHLKLLTIFTDISDMKNHLGISSIEDPNKSTFVDIKLCVKSKFKFSMKVSSSHYLLFSTDNLMYIKQNGKVRHLESKSFKVAVDQFSIFAIKGFKMLKTNFNKEVQAERQNSEGLITEANSIWDVTIENFKMVFPYGFEFYSIFQGEFISIFKWLKLIHKKPKLQPEPLPSDIALKVQEFIFELSDDDFEVKLRDNYELLEDEYKESLKRQKMLETKVSEVVKDRLLLPAGKVEELLTSLQKMNAQIYIQRSKQMKQQSPVRTRLFSWTMCDLCIIILADESMHTPQKVVNHICEMDADSLWPEEGLEFCILWCRMIFASCAEWKFQLRDFPQTWLDIRKFQLWGKLAGAEQEPTARAKRSVTIELSDPFGDVTIERGMTSLKYYYDLNCEVDKYTYSFGPCWEPVIAQCKLCLEKVLGSSRDPSPPLPFWDKIRLIYHGRLTMIVNELKVKLHASLDPYNTTEEMELNWYNTAMDWTNAKFIFKGHLKVLVRTASKYDDVCLLNLPNLKLSIKLKWSCLGDPNDHYSVMPCAPDKLPEYSSNQEHDSFRAFRSQNLNVSLSIETKPEPNTGSPHTDTDYPVALLYGSTLKWFENLKLILSGVTRPTRRGPLFNNNRHKKLTLSRHYRKVHLCVSLQHFQVHYWMSFALQRGFELFGQRISTSSEHTLNLASNFEDDLKHRSRPVWSVGYMNCELMDTEIWLKSALQSEEEEEEAEIKEKPVEKCYLLSVSKVSYGRETTGTCEADGSPTPIHRLVVYHLKGAWTTRNRDVAFALFNSLVKNQKLKKNLSTEALKGFCLNDSGCTPMKNRTRNADSTEQTTPLSSVTSVASTTCQASPSPMSKLQCGGQAATMLQQLISEVDNKPVVFSDDLSMQVTRERRLQGLSGCQQDDVLYKNWLIALINSQVLLKGCETKGYVIVSAAKAEILQRIHCPVWKDHSLVSKTTWVGTLDSMQYYATVSAGKTDFIDENIMWLNVENIQEKDIDSTIISDLPDLPHLVGSGHSVGGVVSETVGASNVGENSPLQLQRIVSRCKCEFFYAGHGESSLNPTHLTEVPPPPTATPDVVGDPDLHEPVDAFTLMHHDLDVCTNSLQYAMILDIVNNLLLYVEPRRKEAYERLQRMRFQLQLQSSQDHRQPIQQLQNHVRCLVAKLRRLEKEIFLLKKEEDWQNEELLSSEIRSLEKQMNELKDQLNSESEELDMMVSCYKETQLRATQKLATLRGDKPSVVPSRANEICFKHAQWRLTENDGQLGIADLVLSNFLYTKNSKSDDSVEHLLELGYIRMTNLLANELYKEVIVPTEIQNNMPVDDRKRAVRIFCREKAPVGGISVKEHFEINVVPLTIGMTKKFYSTMMRFCFSERDPENIDAETDEKNSSKGKKNKESNFYVPIEHKDDVEKMKERAEKNKLFIYIKIPEVPVKVSYKGNKEKNLEDIRDFSLVIPTIEYHNVTWTWLDLCQAMKTDSRRVILSQAIKHKLQIKTNKAIADGGASPQEEDKARMLFGSKLVRNEHRNSKRGILKFPK